MPLCIKIYYHEAALDDSIDIVADHPVLVSALAIQLQARRKAATKAAVVRCEMIAP